MNQIYFNQNHSVDSVMAKRRAASFTTRSIKNSAKASGLRLAMSMLDLTTLEGKDSPEKVRALCAKAICPHGSSASFKNPVPPVAAVCVYPMLISTAKQALVGHNIKDFDNKVINRQMVSYMGRAELPNDSYDTLSVARRLYPLENYRLEAMADKFEIKHDNLHRAKEDVEVTKQVFRKLRREDLWRVMRTSLAEVLPLIGLGILEKNAAMEQENIAFYNAALRYLHQREESDEVVAVLPVTNLEAAEQEEAMRFLDIMGKEEPSNTKDDMDWNLIKAKFQNITLDFERSSYDKSLNAFLRHAVLFTSVDEPEEDEYKDKVTMMTVHSAKGTEFPVVIMIGMEQGNFPLLPRDQSEEEFEEERRLCYVGMTRAEKQLYMTSVRRRMSDIEMTPSQFIWEIRPDLIETVSAKQIRKAWDKERQERLKAKAESAVGSE